MICAIAICALLVGGNGKCEPKPQTVKYEQSLQYAECAAVADFVRAVGPMNGVSMRRWESFNKSK